MDSLTTTDALYARASAILEFIVCVPMSYHSQPSFIYTVQRYAEQGFAVNRFDPNPEHAVTIGWFADGADSLHTRPLPGRVQQMVNGIIVPRVMAMTGILLPFHPTRGGEHMWAILTDTTMDALEAFATRHPDAVAALRAHPLPSTPLELETWMLPVLPDGFNTYLASDIGAPLPEPPAPLAVTTSTPDPTLCIRRSTMEKARRIYEDCLAGRRVKPGPMPWPSVARNFGDILIALFEETGV